MVFHSFARVKTQRNTCPPKKKAQETLHEVCMWKAAVPVPPTIWHLHSFSASQVATIDIPSSTPTAQLSIPFSISPRIASKETPFSWENKSNDLKIVVETSAQIDLKLPPRPQPEKVAPHHTAPVVFHAPAPVPHAQATLSTTSAPKNSTTVCANQCS